MKWENAKNVIDLQASQTFHNVAKLLLFYIQQRLGGRHFSADL